VHGTITRIDKLQNFPTFGINVAKIEAWCYNKRKKACDFSAIIRNYHRDQFEDPKKCGNRHATRRYRGSLI